jgi:integrase
LANKVSANTFNKHIGLLLLVFRILSQDDAAGISSNPWDRIARRKQLSASRRELTTEELRRIVSAAAGETRLLFALGIYTGLRLGDCATLKWTEVDLPRGRIVRVPNKTARSSGKPVIVPLFSDLAGMLAEAYAVRRGEYVMPATAAVYAVKGADVLTRRIQRLFWNCGIECHAPGTGTQIKRKDDGAPVMTEKGNVELEPTGKRAVIACGFHSLRHSFVSLCRQANAPLSVVESIVGHSNPSMTRHYSHVGELEAARAIAALPAVLSVDADARTPERAPLPDWARELAETLTSKNAAKVRTALLAG